MKLRILGCGTSSGVPRIGNDWGACDPAEPRNRRLRVSILVEHDDTRILVDTGPDLREQLLAADIATVDAVTGVIEAEAAGLGRTERRVVRLWFRAQNVRLAEPLQLAGKLP